MRSSEISTLAASFRSDCVGAGSGGETNANLVQAAAHGELALDVIPVDLSAVEAFLGRIGVHVGEPVEEHNDLFGATVQIAARVCQAAAPETVVVSGAVRELVGGQFAFGEPEHSHLQGVTAPVMP